tara:strand:- start:818 stop:1822 length:1005 start_codon:yes stop_codon:yes gene_type:complete
MAHIPGHAPQRAPAPRTNPWNTSTSTAGLWVSNTGDGPWYAGKTTAGATSGLWMSNTGKGPWLAGQTAYEDGEVSFACCGTAGTTPGSTAGCGCGTGTDCGCGTGAPQLSGQTAYEDGEVSFACCGTAGSFTPQQVTGALTADKWSATYQYLHNSTSLPPKAVCTIMAWLGGASPNAVIADMWRSLQEQGWKILNPFALYAEGAGALLHLMQTGKLTRTSSIADVCGKDGMDLGDALKMAASPAYGGSKSLSRTLIALGEGHHQKLIDDSVKSIKKDEKQVVYTLVAPVVASLNAASAAAVQALKKSAGVEGLSLYTLAALAVVGYFAYQRFAR